ncbi:unnamed protein product [Acanthocheilonema viteae]|uniref:Uncharacterized protein n=1 Tax=Acanthocheilonema viteae TaxID=6277 RepID=A0A498S4V2_ACAVI|nr:unnamed protein product [Acanthocheilonema viteae]
MSNIYFIIVKGCGCGSANCVGNILLLRPAAVAEEEEGLVALILTSIHLRRKKAAIRGGLFRNLCLLHLAGFHVMFEYRPQQFNRTVLLFGWSADCRKGCIKQGGTNRMVAIALIDNSALVADAIIVTTAM